MGGSSGLPTPLGVVCVGSLCSTLLLFPVLQKWQLGFLVSLYLVVYNLPNCLHACSYF